MKNMHKKQRNEGLQCEKRKRTADCADYADFYSPLSLARSRRSGQALSEAEWELTRRDNQ